MVRGRAAKVAWACGLQLSTTPTWRRAWGLWCGSCEVMAFLQSGSDSGWAAGYDIASLGQEPADFERYFNYEILHGRWAMLGGLGALVPGAWLGWPAQQTIAAADSRSGAEALQLAGLSDFKEYRWWNVGRAKLSGEDLNYFGLEGFRIAGGQGILIIVVCQVRTECMLAWLTAVLC